MRKILTEPINQLYQFFRGKPIYQSQSYNLEKIEIITATIINNLFVVLLISVIAFLFWKKKRKHFSHAVILLTIVDLFYFSKGNLITFPTTIVEQTSEVQNWLSENINNSRYLSTSGNLPYLGLSVYWTHLRAREPFSPNGLTDQELKEFSRFKKELKALPENGGISTKLLDVSGYAAAIPESNLRFWEEKPSSPNSIKLHTLNDQRLDIAGVRYLVTGYPQDYIKNLGLEKFKLVKDFGEIKIYENNSVWPRAFIKLQDQIVPATIIKYQPTEVIVEVNNPSQIGKLVLTDNNFPDWVAELNGKKVNIENFMGTFRMVDIPQGNHQIRFSYQPKSFQTGAIISFTTLIFILFSLQWRKRKR